VKLTDINLNGIGQFTEDFCGFAIRRYHLPKDWEHILGDERIFWKIRHTGKGYIQNTPPGGTYWVRADNEQDLPHWQVFFVPEAGAEKSFTNFHPPQQGLMAHHTAPDSFECRWFPHKACFTVKAGDLRAETTLGVTSLSIPAAMMRVSLTNTGKRTETVTVIPTIRPWLTAAQSAAWDMPWLYQSSEFDPASRSLCFEMRNPAGFPERRKSLRMVMDQDFERMCLIDSQFKGAGTDTLPEGLVEWPKWQGCQKHMEYGYYLFAALAKKITLQPGETWTANMALADNQNTTGAIAEVLKNLDSELAKMETKKKSALAAYSIRTPDEAFTRFANEYLGLQQQLVLRRGWPCNMMGVRDASQDYTAVAAWYPTEVRRMIMTVFETERSDGWFLRQFSTDGRKGKHDDRPYVDSGLWAWEMVYEYICQTRDFAILDEKLPFLDRDEQTPLLDHLAKLLNYYMTPANIGEHGLCKILEGDWNDSVNRAGLEGRGETVMVSCHLIHALRQALKLDAWLKNNGKKGFPGAEKFTAFAAQMRTTIRKAALNKKGFLNGVFSDKGRWIFSDADPDGQERFNVPVNSFGIVAGIFEPAELEALCAKIKSIRKPGGYPLFTPPIGEPPMEGVGRIGSGDLRPGLGENGTSYNHGCHAFLARALATIGQGDFFYDVMLYLLPYDQTRHPVSQTRTPPYAIVNVYKGAPGREGEGGDAFNSGSIPTAVRNVYQGMLGIYAEPNGIQISPCFPDAWPGIDGQIQYAGKAMRIHVTRNGKAMDVSVNGKKLENGWLSFDDVK